MLTTQIIEVTQHGVLADGLAATVAAAAAVPVHWHSTPDPDQPPPAPNPNPDDVPPPANAPVQEPRQPAPPIKA